jgi:hypothetical protein
MNQTKNNKPQLSALCGVLPAMNFKNLLLVATTAGGLLAASALSAGVVIAETSAAHAEFTAPAPAMVVAPMNIPRQYQDATIRVSLRVDEQGRAHYIDLLDGRDPGLVRHLLPAIAQWQFKPAMKDGRPVSVNVVLPLQLVDRADALGEKTAARPAVTPAT